MEKTELIKWWDALDLLCGCDGRRDVTKSLQLARECLHPDAQWLCSLLPGGDVKWEVLDNVMQGQGDDPRALFLRFHVGAYSGDVLRRAAELGYAPAQSALARWRFLSDERC